MGIQIFARISVRITTVHCHLINNLTIQNAEKCCLIFICATQAYYNGSLFTFSIICDVFINVEVCCIGVIIYKTLV